MCVAEFLRPSSASITALLTGHSPIQIKSPKKLKLEKAMDSCLKGTQFCGHLDFSQVRPVSDFYRTI